MIATLGKYEKSARMVVTAITSLIPIAIVGGLLYAAFFVKAVGGVSSVQPPPIERRDKFLGVAMPTEETIWAVGGNGKIIRSEDGGVKWTVQAAPTIENLQGIAAWDVDRAVTVGGGGIVMQTSDGGKRWTGIQVPKSEVVNKLLNVHAYADGVAWAVGEMGAVIKTSDYGQTWVRVIPEKDQAWNDISFVDKHGILVGEFGQIMTTEDGGATWQSVKSGTKSSLMSVCLRDPLNGVAVGLSGVVLTTHDGGQQWSVSAHQTLEHLNSVTWDGASWVAVGDKGVIVTGSDDGANWKVSRVSEGNLGWNTQILPIHFDGKTKGYILAGASLSHLEDGKFSVFGRAAD